MTVVCASEGYPARRAPATGIDGLDAAAAHRRRRPCSAPACGPTTTVDLVTAGGRVLNVCGTGPDVAVGPERAYEAVDAISWPGMHHRTDIAASASKETASP